MLKLLSLSVTKCHDMKTCGEVKEQFHAFLNSALVGGEWSASLSGRFTSGKSAPDTHWIGGWVGPRAGLVQDNFQWLALKNTVMKLLVPQHRKNSVISSVVNISQRQLSSIGLDDTVLQAEICHNLYAVIMLA
jgi:hypothetical protein